MRTPLRPLARILQARQDGLNPDSIEKENLKLRHEALREKARGRAQFRLLILCARQCGNQRLQRMSTALSLQTLRYSKLGLASVARRQQSARLWREATVALAQGDVERTVALTRQRIDETGEEAIRRLDTPPTDGDAA